MSVDADAFVKLLSQTLTIKEGNGERVIRYDHVAALPVPEGAVGVPEVVIAFLTATDGADRFCSDDEELKAWCIPPHAAVLCDRQEIEYWTKILRDQLVEELSEWRGEGGVSQERMSVHPKGCM